MHGRTKQGPTADRKTDKMSQKGGFAPEKLLRMTSEPNTAYYTCIYIIQY